jgi:hypothetical protein
MWLMLVVPGAEELVGRYRLEHDHYARAGVPAHVTVREPFLPPAEWDDARVRGVLEPLLPVELTLARTEDRPGGLVLLVEPDDALREVTAAVSAAWPELPPHKGARPDLAYHLTVIRTAGPAVRGAAKAELDRRLPRTLTGSEFWAGADTEGGYIHRALTR